MSIEFRSVSEFEQELLREASQDQLMAFTANVAKEVRLSGTEEELRALIYVQENLESFGLKTELLYHEALISLPGAAKLVVNGENLACITHSMAHPTSGLEAEVVYLGKGTLAEYHGVQVAGKVVLIDGLAIPGTVKVAEEQGALGAILINTQYTHEMIVSPIWGMPVPETAMLLPKIPVISVNIPTGEIIKKKLAQRKVSCQIETEVGFDFRPIPTLIAEIRGKEEPEKFVLFSGHIDSWHYGAMDNGAANAGMMEVARVLATHQEELKRSLRFAFWSGHSHGRYAGSASYCDTHWEELNENCVLHINADSLGGKGAAVLTESNCMAETRNLARNVIGALTGQYYEGTRFGRAGDQSFWGTGTPSLFMGLSEQEPSDDPAAAAFSQLFGGGKSGGFGWWWHTTEDTLEKIDPDNLKRDCQIYLLVVYRTLTDNILPVNQRAAVKDIEDGLQAWQDKAREEFDLSESFIRLGQLKELVAKFYEAAAKAGEDLAKQNLVNSYIMGLSRILIPLNYIKGSVFAHDLALYLPPVPKLAEIELLLATDKESDKYRFLQNSLVHKRNEVNFALQQAIKLLKDALKIIDLKLR